MPIYEIELTMKKMICVEAEDMELALEIARDNASIDCDSSSAEIEDEFNPEDPKELGFIEYYKENHEYYTE